MLSFSNQSRLIIASNRLPSLDAAAPAQGGLVVGLMPALRSRTGLWFGLRDQRDKIYRSSSESDVSRIPISVPPDLLKGYYTEFSNRALWPALHYREDLVRFGASDFEAYLAVNRTFAEEIARAAQPNDLIWVHDYHLIPLARELRLRNLHNPIGLFLHTPFSAPEVLQTIPVFSQLCEMLCHYDLIGLQTSADADNCRRALRGARLERCQATIGHFPIGIDAQEMAALAEQSINSRRRLQFLRSFADVPIIVGIDRLDYSKGTEQRLNAFAAFLKSAQSRAATLVQISPPTRKEIPEYASLRSRVEHLAGEINAIHNEPDWVAIRLVHKSYSRSTLAGIYRSARACLVTPLRDGMNLVAKEFVACQDPGNPGVLILSKFAGAAEQLSHSLIVNPHDEKGVADAIARALAMDIDERKERHRLLAQSVFHDTAEAWAASFLRALEEIGTRRVHTTSLSARTAPAKIIRRSGNESRSQGAQRPSTTGSCLSSPEPI